MEEIFKEIEWNYEILKKEISKELRKLSFGRNTADIVRRFGKKFEEAQNLRKYYKYFENIKQKIWFVKFANNLLKFSKKYI